MLMQFVVYTLGARMALHRVVALALALLVSVPPNTARLAERMTSFNPDSTWQKVSDTEPVQ